MKKYLVLLLIAALVLGSTSAMACTGFYVGKDVSADGTFIFGHTVDAYNTAQAGVRVYPRVEEAGRTYNPYANANPYRNTNDTIAFPLPEVTYAYITNEWISSIYDGSVVNEMGVGVSGAVTCYVTKDINALDPNVRDTGLSEAFLCQLVGLCAATAREGVQVLGDYVAMYGNAEKNSIVIADQNEAWYCEYYTGHQWCAVKLPNDAVAVYGNNFMIHSVNDYEEYMASDELFSLPADNGLAVYDENGDMDLFETYSGGAATYREGNNKRTWYGHVLLAPSTAGEFELNKNYPHTYAPDAPVTLEQIFELTRSRYEDTEWCPETNSEVQGMRVIAVENQTNIGAIQLFDTLPADMAGVIWTCTANAEHSVYLPVSNLVTAVADSFSYYEGLEGGMAIWDENMAHWCFKRLGAVAEQNRAKFGNGVRAYWKTVEDQLLAEYPEIIAQTAALYATDKAAAQEFITNYTIGIQESAVEDAITMYNELIWHIVSNVSTSKGPAAMKEFVPSIMPKAEEVAPAA